MYIRTKIVATLGPATGEPDKIRKLIQAGVDMFRINFSHGDNHQRKEFLHNIRLAERQLKKHVAICADLCGPKIRVGMIKDGGVLLAQGQKIIIQRDEILGNAQRISTTLGELIDDVKVGEKILLDDGKIRLSVQEIHKPSDIICRVEVGGILKNGKGVNLPDTDLNLSALTEKDCDDAHWLSGEDFDYVALSFVQKPGDIQTLRKILQENNCAAHIIAKLEKPRALDKLDEIIEVSDGIMVARGDLGVEMDFPQVPVAQKRIARRCQQTGTPCIIATQMLESMISAPVPTRAEVSDVANAVLDHADAVMLSGETAVGEYPVKAVEVMNSTADAIQAYHDQAPTPLFVEDEASPTTAAIASAVRNVVKGGNIAAVAVYTSTGATARTIAKNRLNVPIIAMSADVSAVRRMNLYYGVVPVKTALPKFTNHVLEIAQKVALDTGAVQVGDRIVVVTGRPFDTPGKTNTLIIHEICQAD